MAHRNGDSQQMMLLRPSKVFRVPILAIPYKSIGDENHSLIEKTDIVSVNNGHNPFAE